MIESKLIILDGGLCNSQQQLETLIACHILALGNTCIVYIKYTSKIVDVVGAKFEQRT